MTILDMANAIAVIDRMKHWKVQCENSDGKRRYSCTLLDGGRRVTCTRQSVLIAINAAIEKLAEKDNPCKLKVMVIR